MTETTTAAVESSPSNSTAEATPATPAVTTAAEVPAQAPVTPTDGEQAQTESTEAPQGAPEKYEFQAPEGQSYDPKVIEGFSEAMKELGIPQDKAQATLNKLAPLIAAQQQEAVEAQSQQWADALRNDKMIGGTNLDANIAVAKGALEKFGSPELTTLLNESGLGNNPEMARLLYNVGKATSGDTFVGGRQGGNASTQSFADRMYGSKN
jgi:hypothetical protein